MIDYESRHNLRNPRDPLAWIEYRAGAVTLPDEVVRTSAHRALGAS